MFEYKFKSSRLTIYQFSSNQSTEAVERVFLLSYKLFSIMRLTLFLLLLFFTANIQAQQYSDYLGVGHDIGITTTTSDNSGGSDGANTVNGLGLMPDAAAASRFLGQATFGSDYESIQALTQQGFTAWLDEQIESPPEFNFLTHLDDTLVPLALDGHLEFGFAEEDFGTWGFFRLLWFESIMKGNDLLRDRMAFALSQIFVISENSDLFDYNEGLADYYDILHTNAFGNFRDVLYEVSMHPTMGAYLSHLNNPKADPSVNRFPDENYAREIMQLFSIGLYELNNDGSRVLDASGNPIPSYGQDEIREFAKIFTGLGPRNWSRYVDPSDTIQYGPINFGDCLWCTDLTTSMKMFEDWHEPGPKELLNGYVVPAGQTGMEDINDAIDNIFNHQNVGPFIGRQLIQRFVKSNPTPEYIDRVATAFNDNGSGVRGDMGAVIRAILLDTEARDCSWIEVADHGKLREPLIRYTHYLRAFNAYNENDRFYNWAWWFRNELEQFPLHAPTVFNFYLPDYAPLGEIQDLDLVAPEFQIFNSATSLSHVNAGHVWMMWEYLTDEYLELHYTPDQVYTETVPEGAFTKVDLSDEMAIFTDDWVIHPPEQINAFLDRMDIILFQGTLTQQTRDVILEAMSDVYLNPEWRTRFLLYMVINSPNYSVQK